MPYYRASSHRHAWNDRGKEEERLRHSSQKRQLRSRLGSSPLLAASGLAKEVVPFSPFYPPPLHSHSISLPPPFSNSIFYLSHLAGGSPVIVEALNLVLPLSRSGRRGRVKVVRPGAVTSMTLSDLTLALTVHNAGTICI